MPRGRPGHVDCRSASTCSDPACRSWVAPLPLGLPKAIGISGCSNVWPWEFSSNEDTTPLSVASPGEWINANFL